MKNLISIFLAAIFLFGCKPEINSSELVQQYLGQKNLVADHTIDDELANLIEETNCVVKPYTSLHFVTSKQWDQNDTNQILIIPFRKKKGEETPSGFSDIKNRVVFVCPLLIKKFVRSNSLSDSAGIDGHLGMILLHEAGHFILGIAGNLDAGADRSRPSSSTNGNHTVSGIILMTDYKKMELKVDSLAAVMIKKGVSSTDMKCFNYCFNIELAVGGAEFMVFGKRKICDFGTQTPDLIKDESYSHPNIELRLAFINYYLNPTEEKRRQIDEYIYAREIAPRNGMSIFP